MKPPAESAATYTKKTLKGLLSWVLGVIIENIEYILVLLALVFNRDFNASVII
jgi:hypothetical protein